jgi:hypothetical protein
MIEVALLPFLMFSDVLLISSLEKYEYGNILIVNLIAYTLYHTTLAMRFLQDVV